jgi:hypothetical protein
MNFVAHSVVAATEGGSDAYAFGAMVPDLRAFVAGADLVPPPADREDVDAGVRSHHRVDSAFHADAQFKAWVATVSEELGNGRAARAAAHVAVELAIDGQLLDARRAGAFYDALAWARDALSGSWLTVVDRLASDELVAAYGSPDGVARRTVGAISRRPRLSRLALDAGALSVAIANVGPAIAGGLDAVLRSAGAQDDRQHQ